MKILNIVFAAFTMFMVTSCTNGFEEINTNNNSPIDVQPELLLRNVLWDYNENMAYEGFVSGGLLSQHFTAVDFNLFDRHSLLEPQFGGNPWPIMYSNLRNNEIVLTKSLENPTFEVYEGPARIMKAFISGELTDMFGDIPYSEAVNGKGGTLNPKYDAQEDIYLAEGGIIDNLEKGIEAIDAYQGNIPLDGDIIDAGDLSQWRRLANSLLIKAYMRISDVADFSSELEAIFSEGDYIQDGIDDAVFNFTDGAPNNFRMATARIGDFNVYVMSETSEEILKAYDDPRIAKFFRPTESDPSDFKGLLNGPDASMTTTTIADLSLAGTVFRENTGLLKANVMTSWETNLFLAEAALKGMISGDAQALYELGVTQSFNYWEVEMPNDYFSGLAAFSPVDGLEKIITQKWMSSYTDGFEGWIEFRRTGFPALKTVSASLNDDLIPVKMPYPFNEAALNTLQFEAVTAALGGNSINAPVWWDIN